MAMLPGSLGSVTVPKEAGGQAGLIYDWKADFVRPARVVNTFDDAGTPKVKRGGMFSCRGVLEAYFDMSDTEANFVSATPELGLDADATQGIIVEGATGTAAFVLIMKSGKQYAFTGMFNTIGVNTEKIGLAIVTMSFVACSAVTPTG